jgi:hypothetical protein
MKVHLDCFPCFLKQVVIAVRLGTNDEVLRERVIRSALKEIELSDTGKTPAHSTTFIHRRIREMLGGDPFSAIKSEYNRKALAMYGGLRESVLSSPDPLFTATRLAIAGNIIDFGIFTSVDIEGTVSRALAEPFAVDDYRDFMRAVGNAGDVLYLLDNAGEIVFDRLLIETLLSMGKRVTAVVKGAPVLNDATMKDAREAGITGLCEVIDNGSDCVGTILYMTSPEFNRCFREAGLVISKGQGNFETLMNERKERMFFLFQAKCDVVSRELGLPLGAMLLKRGEAAAR